MDLQTTVVEFITGLSASYPWLTTVLVAIGTFRALFKPVMTLLDQVVVATTWTQTDNELLNKVKASKVYKALVWVVDYLASVKLPK